MKCSKFLIKKREITWLQILERILFSIWERNSLARIVKRIVAVDKQSHELAWRPHETAGQGEDSRSDIVI